MLKRVSRVGHCAVGAGVELAYAVYGVPASIVLYSVSAGWDCNT